MDEGALRLIARAADGSVRDGLSILDQAISHGNGTVTEAQMRDMLGLADRARIFDLFEAVLAGDIAKALDQLNRQYALGADPAVVTQDLLELTHWLTRLKLQLRKPLNPLPSPKPSGSEAATWRRNWPCRICRERGRCC